MSKAQARMQVSSTNALYAVHLSGVGWDWAVIACPDAANFRLLTRWSEDDPGAALEVRARPAHTLLGNPAVLLYSVGPAVPSFRVSRRGSRAPAAPRPPTARGARGGRRRRAALRANRRFGSRTPARRPA